MADTTASHFDHASEMRDSVQGSNEQLERLAELVVVLVVGEAQLVPPVAGPPAAELVPLDIKGTAPEPYPIIAIAFGDNEVARRRLSRQLTVVGRLRPSALPTASTATYAAPRRAVGTPAREARSFSLFASSRAARDSSGPSSRAAAAESSQAGLASRSISDQRAE